MKIDEKQACIVLVVLFGRVESRTRKSAEKRKQIKRSEINVRKQVIT